MNTAETVHFENLDSKDKVELIADEESIYENEAKNIYDSAAHKL